MTPRTKSIRNRQLYYAHLRLHALVGLAAAIVLVAAGASIGVVFAVAAAIGLFWGLLVYIRLRRSDGRVVPPGKPHQSAGPDTEEATRAPAVRV